MRMHSLSLIRTCVFLHPAACVIMCAVSVFPASPPPPVNDEWVTETIDDFDAGELDTSVWKHERYFYYFQHETAYRIGDEYLSFDDTGAVFEVALDYNEGKYYQAPCISTLGKRSVGFGYIEASIKAPVGEGVLPLFWTHDAGSQMLSWPPKGGIIIFGRENDTVFGQVSTAQQEVETTCTYVVPEGFGDSYHRYGIFWDSSSIEWYIDDTLRGEYDISGDTPEFHRAHALILNIAIDKSKHTEGIIDTAAFPLYMHVDYIRHWQTGTGTRDIPFLPRYRGTVSMNTTVCALYDILGRKRATLPGAPSSAALYSAFLKKLRFPPGAYLMNTKHGEFPAVTESAKIVHY